MDARDTSTSRADVEEDVASWFGRKHCVLTGRATTALYLLFESLDVHGEIIFPAYTCPSPAYAADYAGATPRFCEVGGDYTIDPEDLADRIGPETDAVVAIDCFGHPARYAEIGPLCREQDVLLVEDAAQAVGTEYDGRTTGSFGDAAVVSFGNKKPLDAGGGGAVLTDDDEIHAAVSSAAATIPTRPPERREALYDHYRDLYYAIDELRDLTDGAEALFGALPSAFRELYITDLELDRLPAIRDAIDSYHAAAETRRRHAAIYRSELDHPAITHPSPAGDPVYYRYSVRLPDEATRDAVVEALREQEFHASTLYDPIHRRFGVTDALPTSVDLTERTLNLWVDQTIDAEYVHDCALAVQRSVESTIDGDDISKASNDE